MAKSLLIPNDKQAFVDRLNKLTPRANAQWGKMDVGQMLRHLNELMQVANGTRVLPSNTFVSSLIGRLVRNRFINNDRPLPKGLGNAPLPVSTGFEAEKKQLMDALNGLDFNKTSSKPLPLFGKLSADEWDKFLSKQLEHHLTQFGV